MPLKGRGLDINRLLLIAILALLSYSVVLRHSHDSRDAVLRAAAGQSVNDVIDSASRSSMPGTQKGARFAVMSMNTKTNSYDWMAISSKDRYARKHGYDMIWDWEQQQQGVFKYWDKLGMIKNATEAVLAGARSYEWVLMIDYDTLITNTTITLDDVVEESLQAAERAGKPKDEIDMIVTPDCWPLNVGAMLFRTTPWTVDLVQRWWDERNIRNKDGHMRSEQDVLQDMIKNNILGAETKSIAVLQWKLNAFPEEIKCYDERDPIPWRSGMFLLHFAGAWAYMKGKDPTGTLMRKYYPYIDNDHPDLNAFEYLTLKLE